MSDVGRWKVRTSYQLGTSHRPLKRYTTTGTFTEIPGNTMERITVCKATAGHGTRKPHERYLSGHPSTKDFCKRHSSPLQDTVPEEKEGRMDHGCNLDEDRGMEAGTIANTKHPLDILESEEVTGIFIGPIAVEEVKQAIEKLKSGEASW
ncbi:hypothetical protein OS493_026450 [Desmophyllum pertusum]|uniref:Uncharacterized protein n=1 Tax=Desmophyllum pertusum TaxID=174260 RepID=A0A9W9Z159_9CNID|nr:hypothetical protein OS493_026450 [Desmophyllum pertusum]